MRSSVAFLFISFIDNSTILWTIKRLHTRPPGANNSPFLTDDFCTIFGSSLEVPLKVPWQFILELVNLFQAKNLQNGKL